jgi:hypothetical protein
MLAVIVFMCSFQTKKAEKIVFFGDSITEYGVRPDGYITLFQQKLKDNNKAGIMR